MSVIPFGFIGALIGHILFGKTISMMSIFGLVALAGVIVNDSLLLVDFVNSARREGLSLHDAISRAGVQRFRAILLTTLTTFFGLVFGTVMTLIMIPSLYLILEDILGLIGGRKQTPSLEGDERVNEFP